MNFNRHELAARIVRIESDAPGTVKCCANGMMMQDSLSELKSLGYKKPIFANGTQFFYDTILTYPDALSHMLQFMILTRERADGRYSLWTGKTGEFAGTCGLSAIRSFSPFPGIIMAILTDPFHTKIEDLLYPETR